MADSLEKFEQESTEQPDCHLVPATLASPEAAPCFELASPSRSRTAGACLQRVAMVSGRF